MKSVFNNRDNEVIFIIEREQTLHIQECYTHMMPYTEKHTRSIAKAISYRIVSISLDLLIIFAITKKADLTLWIVVLSNLVSIFLYYFHERIWNKVHFGRRLIEPKTHSSDARTMRMS